CPRRCRDAGPDRIMSRKKRNADAGSGDATAGAARPVAAEWGHGADSAEWLRVTLSSIGDGVITTDDAGRVTFLNPVAQELTGWTQADAAGVSLQEVF